MKISKLLQVLVFIMFSVHLFTWIMPEYISYVADFTLGYTMGTYVFEGD